MATGPFDNLYGYRRADPVADRANRYERGNIVFTSNKHFSNWGNLLSDRVIATVLLDRLLQAPPSRSLDHGQVFPLKRLSGSQRRAASVQLSRQ